MSLCGLDLIPLHIYECLLRLMVCSEFVPGFLWCYSSVVVEQALTESKTRLCCKWSEKARTQTEPKCGPDQTDHS